MAIKIKRGYMKLKIICEYCKQEFNSKKSCYKHKHEIHHIKNGQAPKYDLTCKFCGYTNYITKAGMTLHQKYCKLNPDKIICIGHPVSDATKNKISNGMHIAVLEGRNKGWKTRNIKSQPEKFFEKVLNNNHIHFEREKKVGKYFLDFVIGTIDLEIDGKQHKYPERVKSDLERDKFLRSEGYFVYRIAWNEINSENGKEIMKGKIDLLLDFLNCE